MFNTIFFLSQFILTLSTMLVFKLQVFLDLNFLKVTIWIKVFNFKVLKINIDLLTLTYSFYNFKKRKRLKIFLKKKDKYFIEQIKNNLLSKLYYDEFTFYSLINTSNPYITANIIGLLNVLSEGFKYVCFIKDEDIDVMYLNNANFINDKSIVEFNVKVYFTIFDMLFALILSCYRRSKYAK